MKRSLLSISGIALLGLIVVLLNGISQTALGGLNFDLTEDRLFSLSGGTKNIIQSIEEPIKLKFYFSKTDSSRSPAVKLYGARVADLLREYSRIGKRKIDLEIYDPRPDTEEEEWAQKYGLTPVQTTEGDKIFFGLAGVNSDGKEVSIPFFNFARQEFLEYDITKMLYSLIDTKRPNIGVISSIDLKGAAAAPGQQEQEQSTEWYFLTQLQQTADVTIMDPQTPSIDPKIDILVIIHPKNFSEQLLYSIDQFVLKGGKLFAAVDPFSQSDEPKPDPSNPMAAMTASRGSELNRLTNAWGIDMAPSKVIGDRSYSMKVSTGPQREPIPFLAWIGVPKQGFNSSDVVTNSLEQMVFAWAGAFTIRPVDGEAVEILASSSPDSKLYEASDFQFGGGDPEKMMRTFVPEGKSYPIALRISGKLKTAFPEGKPELVKKDAGQAGAGETIRESGGASNVILVSDVDFLSDRFSIQRQNFLGTMLVSLFNDNQVFFQNAVENLNGSEDLISLRSRGRFSRPFTRVQSLERQAQERFQQEELVLEAKLNGANQRLNALQNQQSQPGSKQVFSSAVLDEIKKFREERKEAQDRLREVRRDLRQDIEGLGQRLFFICTFLVPLILIFASVFIAYKNHSSRRKVNKVKE